MDDQEVFEKGRRSACAALAAWRERGHSSLDACRARLQRVARNNVQQAKRQYVLLL